MTISEESNNILLENSKIQKVIYNLIEEIEIMFDKNNQILLSNLVKNPTPHLKVSALRRF